MATTHRPCGVEKDHGQDARATVAVTPASCRFFGGMGFKPMCRLEAGDTCVSMPGENKQPGVPITDGCVEVDPSSILPITPRTFAFRVCGQSMLGAGIQDGDIVVGSFAPSAKENAIVVALVDGEPVVRRLVMHHKRPLLVCENPNCRARVPMSELVIQGLVHSVVRKIKT